MAISETGHAVNVANIKVLADTVKSFGADYDPVDPAISVASLTAKWTAADAKQKALNKAVQLAAAPIQQRQALFAPLNKIITRSFNYLDQSKALQGIKDNAKSLADKIRGVSKKKKGGAPAPTPPPTPAPPVVGTTSKSHQSYVMRVDSLDSYIQLLATEPLYSPKIVDLQVASLTKLYGDLKKANDDMTTVLTPVDNAREARDFELYDEKTGAFKLQEDVKKYVKSLYGTSDVRTKKVLKIKFRNLY